MKNDLCPPPLAARRIAVKVISCQMPTVTADVLIYDYPGSICSQMARLALEEKGVAYRRHNVDIMERGEQFASWYTALNPRAVVPTLRIGENIVTDTISIVHCIDGKFNGPSLTPAEPSAAAHMEATMRDIMGLHYGVLLYARRRQSDGTVPVVIERGRFLRALKDTHPERAEILDRRIEGNERLQRILADPAEVERHVGEARALVDKLDRALSETRFVSADTYTLADTFATAALARFRLHGFDTWWSGANNRHVAGYYASVRERPSWTAAEVVESGGEHGL